MAQAQQPSPGAAAPPSPTPAGEGRLRTDSERLDWLEQRGREVWKDGRVFVVVPDGNPLKCWSGSGRSLREAIDEAMEKNDRPTPTPSPALPSAEAERRRAEGGSQELGCGVGLQDSTGGAGGTVARPTPPREGLLL